MVDIQQTIHQNQEAMTMYVPYKNMKNQPDNPQAVDKVDAHDIQADVLATDVSENSKIPSLKQLKTETKIPTKAINALNEQLGNAQASASDAVQRTVALEETVDQVAQRVTRMETNGTGSAGGVSFTATNDWMRTQVKDVRSWQGMSTPSKTATAINNVPGYDFSDDVRKFLPSTINDVTFTNTDDEESVKIYWNIDDLSAGDHEYTADYGLGYYSSTKAPTYGLHVYKQIEQYEYETNPNAKIDENGYYEIPLNGVVANYIPQKIKNVSFTNAEPEEYVNLVWPEIKTNQVIKGTYTANVPDGYCVKGKPYAKISFINPDDIEQIVGFVQIIGQESGRSYPTFVRVDEHGEEISFSTQHPIYRNIKNVTLSAGEFVEIPITYVKNEILTTGKYAGKTCYYISNKESKGFHVHPAFLDKNGNPCALQIAKYPSTLDENNLLCSTAVDSNSYYEFDDVDYDYIVNEVNKLNTNGETGYDLCSIYTQDFLARLISIQKLNSNPSYNDYSYINIVFPLIRVLTAGIRFDNNKFYIMSNDGSNTMIDTNIMFDFTTSESSTGSQFYAIDYFTNVIEHVNFNDLFIPKSVVNVNKNSKARALALVDDDQWLERNKPLCYFVTLACPIGVNGGLYNKETQTTLKGVSVRLIRHKSN